GEPHELLPISQRRRQLVVFGREESRRSIYRQHLQELTNICKQLGLQEIIDIGPGRETKLETPIKLVQLGVMSAEDIDSVLKQTMVGVLNDPAAVLAKAGIFAAYASHAVAPVNFSCDRREREDGLVVIAQFFYADW